MFATVEQALEFGSDSSRSNNLFWFPEMDAANQESSQAFAHAHEYGMATILWCYLRNDIFKQDKDYHVAADLTGQANHLGVTIQADIIKQKLPECNNGYEAVAKARGPQLRENRQARLFGFDNGSPDRSNSLSSAQLLCGKDGFN